MRYKCGPSVNSTSDAGGRDRKAMAGRIRRAEREIEYTTIQVIYMAGDATYLSHTLNHFLIRKECLDPSCLIKK